MHKARSVVSASLVIAMLFSLSAATSPPQGMPGHSPQSHPEHVRSIDKIIAAFYDTVSGPKGQARDWDRYRGLYFPGARLSAARSAHGTAVVSGFTVDEFIEAEGGYIEKSGYFERSASVQIQQFGQIAQVLTVYESRRTAEDEKPYSRGVNSIQLVESAGRWWIVSVLWQRESEEFPIPEAFLGK